MHVCVSVCIMSTWIAESLRRFAAREECPCIHPLPLPRGALCLVLMRTWIADPSAASPPVRSVPWDRRVRPPLARRRPPSRAEEVESSVLRSVSVPPRMMMAPPP